MHALQFALDASPKRLGHRDRNSVAELTTALRPRIREMPLVGKCLETGKFADSEIAYGVIIVTECILTAWVTMIAGFDCFGWPVPRATSMARIRARIGNADMVVVVVMLRDIDGFR